MKTASDGRGLGAFMLFGLFVGMGYLALTIHIPWVVLALLIIAGIDFILFWIFIFSFFPDPWWFQPVVILNLLFLGYLLVVTATPMPTI